MFSISGWAHALRQPHASSHGIRFSLRPSPDPDGAAHSSDCNGYQETKSGSVGEKKNAPHPHCTTYYCILTATHTNTHTHTHTNHTHTPPHIHYKHPHTAYNITLQTYAPHTLHIHHSHTALSRRPSPHQATQGAQRVALSPRRHAPLSGPPHTRAEGGVGGGLRESHHV